MEFYANSRSGWSVADIHAAARSKSRQSAVCGEGKYCSNLTFVAASRNNLHINR